MGWVNNKGSNSVQKFKEGGKVRTNRGEGDKYKTIYTMKGGPQSILVEQDLDKKERRESNRKKRKEDKAKKEAKAKADKSAKDKAELARQKKEKKAYDAKRGPNDPPWSP